MRYEKKKICIKENKNVYANNSTSKVRFEKMKNVEKVEIG